MTLQQLSIISALHRHENKGEKRSMKNHKMKEARNENTCIAVHVMFH